MIAVGQTFLRVPALTIDLAEGSTVIAQQSCPAIGLMLEVDEAAIAVLLLEARQVFGKDVRVDVDFHLSALVPQFLQVDRAASL